MRRALRAVETVVLTGVAAVAILAVCVLVLLPRASGAVPLTVLSGSMSPTIPTGSVVLVKPVDPQAIEAGDVITFQTAPGVAQFVTHRVVRVQHDTDPLSFVTKGDANRGEDIDPVPAGAVRGEVWFHVPYLGTLSEAVKGPRGIGLLAAGAGVVLLAAAVRRLRAARESASSESSTDEDAEQPAVPTNVRSAP